MQSKLRVARPDDLGALLAAAELQQRQCLTELQQLQRPALAQAADPAVPWSAAAALLIEDFRIRWLQLLVDWLERVRAVLERRADPPGIVSPSR